jgi:hypothetical protein
MGEASMSEPKIESANQITNGELSDADLDKVAGGGAVKEFVRDVMTGATLGLGGISVVQSVTNVVLKTAEDIKAGQQ